MMCLEKFQIHCDGVGEVLNDERFEGSIGLGNHVMASAMIT
jgi:hypothetical protein